MKDKEKNKRAGDAARKVDQHENGDKIQRELEAVELQDIAALAGKRLSGFVARSARRYQIVPQNEQRDHAERETEKS